MKLYLDFETRSTIDLEARDTDNYTSHPTTEVICLGYAFGDESVQIVKLGERIPDRLLHHVASGGEIVAHNLAFDAAVWNNVLSRDFRYRDNTPAFPVIKPEQSICTAAKCGHANIPRSLKRAGEFLNLPFKKLDVGQVLINRLSRPKSINPLVWDTRADALEAMYEYCKQDVETCRSLDKTLPDLPPSERRVWELDYTINARGLRCDLEFVRNSVRIVSEHKAELDRQIKAATGGLVNACSEAKKICAWATNQGFDIESLAKNDLAQALDKNPPTHVADVLRMRQAYAKSSTAKLGRIVDSVSPDGRLRGQFQYYGAATGRFSGRGAQPQNFPRLKRGVDESLDIVSKVLVNDAEGIKVQYGSPLDAVSSVLRCLIVAAPGKELIGGDFSAIEARVVAWLAGQVDVLDVFRRKEDLYCYSASRIYGRKITPDDEKERFIGKVATLALGYQGSVGAFENMARLYGLNVPEAEAKKIVKLWRDTNPDIVRYWKNVENAAIAAVERPGCNFPAGRAGCLSLFRYDAPFLKVKLPSGRVLYYPRPEVTKAFKFGHYGKRLSYEGQVVGKVIIGKIETYGGSLVENLTQAIARDCMVESMFRVEERGWPLVATIHDELVAEVPAGSVKKSEFAELMSASPSWAPDLPLSVESWTGPRYLKT